MITDQEMLDAFVAEFPEAYMVNSVAGAGLYEEVWPWLFDLTDKMRPAISDELRQKTIDFFVNSDEEYYDWYLDEVRTHLAKLPRKETSAV
ncbi:MAG: hypothetical protein M3Y83_06940 [Actinomycetota bacterium]|nr:hypothetical protein [Actinomycetota bacterium]